jgi:hypothetical protein
MVTGGDPHCGIKRSLFLWGMIGLRKIRAAFDINKIHVLASGTLLIAEMAKNINKVGPKG